RRLLQVRPSKPRWRSRTRPYRAFDGSEIAIQSSFRRLGVGGGISSWDAGLSTSHCQLHRPSHSPRSCAHGRIGVSCLSSQFSPSSLAAVIACDNSSLSIAPLSQFSGKTTSFPGAYPDIAPPSSGVKG